MGGESVYLDAMHAIIKHAFDPATPPFRTAIINISGGASLTPAPQFEALMRTMIAGVGADGNPDPDGKRVLFVVAAGNATPRDGKGHPAQCAQDFSVASISAPNRYRNLPAQLSSGTSYATPHVSGLTARLLEKDPTLTPVQLERMLKESPSIVLGLAVPVDAPPPPDRRRSLR